MNLDAEISSGRGVARLAPDPLWLADSELVARVRRAGMGSPEYRYLKAVLEEIAVGTLTNLEKKKVLHSEILKKGLTLWRPVPTSYSENFPTITHLAVWSASPKFMKKQVLDGGWHESGSATIRTFFVSAAMFEFAAEYNRFCREEASGSASFVSDLETLIDSGECYTDTQQNLSTEETVVAREAIRSVVADHLASDPRLQVIVLRTAQQYSQAEIAEELGMSAEAVSSAIRRLRRRVS